MVRLRRLGHRLFLFKRPFRIFPAVRNAVYRNDNFPDCVHHLSERTLLKTTTFARDNIFVHIVKWLYASDTATNLFPSIHVYNSIAVNIAVWRSDAFKHKHAMRCGSAILMVSIILSTMFLKQHSVFDVVTGMITAAGMYMIVYVNNPFRLPVRQEKYEQKLHRI